MNSVLRDHDDDASQCGHHVSSIDHTRLPTELWIRILHFATTVQGQLYAEPQDPFEDNAASLPLPHILSPHSARDAFLEAQATRASLVRVCKTWHTIGTPYLYTSICVSSSNTLPALANALTHHGKRVLRLDIMLVDADNHHPLPLSDIFSRLPQLEILNVATRASSKITIPHQAMCALRETCAPSLRSISWDPSSALLPSTCDMQSLLCGVSNLRTLGKLHWPDCGPGYPTGCSYTLPIFKKLGSLTLMSGHEDHGADPPFFPALRQLVLQKMARGGCIDAFVHRHAHMLQKAIVEVTAGDQEVLAPLMGCKKLDTLVLHMAPDMVRTLSLWRMPPSLRQLGIFVHETEGEARELVVLLGHISTMEAPGLRVVRLMHLAQRNLESFLKSDGFALVYRLFARAEWRLEDCNGRPLVALQDFQFLSNRLCNNYDNL